MQDCTNRKTVLHAWMNIFFFYTANLHPADGFTRAEHVAEVFNKQVLRLTDVCWSVRC